MKTRALLFWGWVLFLLTFGMVNPDRKRLWHEAMKSLDQWDRR